MSRLCRVIAAGILFAVFLSPAPGVQAYSPGTQASDLEIRVRESKRVFEEFTWIPASSIPRGYVRDAHVILIFPNYVKGGFIYAARFGHGIVMVKNPETGRWSPPAFVRLGGASFGLQAGVEWTDLVLIGKGDATLLNMLASGFNWGGSVGATAGPWGRHMEFNFDWLMKSSLFAYSRSRGVFASVAVEGTVLSFDEIHNEIYYGRGVRGTDVLYGRISYNWPQEVRELVDTVERYENMDERVTKYRAAPAPQPVSAPQPAAPEEPAPQVIQARDDSVYTVRRIVSNIKVYFDFDSAKLRPDAEDILAESAQVLKKNPELAFAVSGHTDNRGSAEYNMKLGLHRAEAIRNFMVAKGVAPERVKIISRGELDAAAQSSDLEGMQKDRFAHFVVAELQRAKLAQAPAPGSGFQAVGKRMYVGSEEKDIESGLKVATREHVVGKGETLWSIAREELGSAHRWRYIWDLNRDRITDPDALVMGQKVLIPVE